MTGIPTAHSMFIQMALSRVRAQLPRNRLFKRSNAQISERKHKRQVKKMGDLGYPLCIIAALYQSEREAVIELSIRYDR